MTSLFTIEQYGQLAALIAEYQRMQRRWRKMAITLFVMILYFAPLMGIHIHLGRWWLVAFNALPVALSLGMLVRMAQEYSTLLNALRILIAVRDAKTREQVNFWADQYACLLINKSVDIIRK